MIKTIKYLQTIVFLFVNFISSQRTEQLVCKQEVNLGRPALDYIRDSCCPADDPNGRPYTKEIQGCCCGLVYRKDRQDCCQPDGCGFGTERVLSLGQECKRDKCTFPPNVEIDGEDFDCPDGVKAGDKCTFGCEEGFILVDENNVGGNTTQATICNGDTFEWDITKPDKLCCIPECVSRLKTLGVALDFMVVLGFAWFFVFFCYILYYLQNWNIIRQFLYRMIDILPLSEDTCRMSVVTYNSDVERVFDFQDSITLSKDELENKVTETVYAGRGTHTYKGLQEIYDVDIMNNSLNRPDVEDVLLVITDGVSRGQSQISHFSTAIKDQGVEFYAIGIGAEASQEEIEAMASEPSEIYTKMITVFEELQKTADSFLEKLCPEPACP